MLQSKTPQASRDFTIRKARKADSKAVIDLITGLAKFERLKPPDSGGKVRLVRDIFSKKTANVFVATTGRKLIGYALFFYTYSSFEARPTLYLEDIFVTKDEGSKSVGEALFAKCRAEAIRFGCSRMEWAVLTWNKKAMKFYKRLGAERLEDLRLYRLSIRRNRARTNKS